MNALVYIVTSLLIYECRATDNYHYDKGTVEKLSPCPGHYCGRTLLSNGSWSACGACERGFRRNASSACVACTDALTHYDWLYLGCMCLLPIVFHLICIDSAARKRVYYIKPCSSSGAYSFTKKVIVLYLSAILEVLLAAIITLLTSEPKGQLNIVTCGVRYIADWYPLFHNPNPNYEGQLYCTQEAVYPLYSMIFVFYTLCLLIMLGIRPILSAKLMPDRGKLAVYSAMYFLPALIFIHALLGGLIYYSFPYIVIIMSIISNAAYYAYQLDQSMTQLFLGTINNGRSILILAGHWFLHAYGIMSVTQLKQPYLVTLVPLPAMFYILTSRFSNPST